MAQAHRTKYFCQQSWFISSRCLKRAGSYSQSPRILSATRENMGLSKKLRPRIALRAPNEMRAHMALAQLIHKSGATADLQGLF